MPRATKEETDIQTGLFLAGHWASFCVCVGMVFRLQEIRTGLISTLGIHVFSCRKGDGVGSVKTDGNVIF